MQGTKLKALAKPEDPDSVEDIFTSDNCVTLPTDIFKLKKLSSILNFNTWQIKIKTIRQYLIW